MGRKLAFDRDKALRDAMENFWERGYESTSMRDLAQNLGIHLGSVYNALGTKEKVFEEALRLHFETYQAPKLERLKKHPNAVEALEAMLSQVAAECAEPDKALGCFIINSLDEITKINDGVTDFLHDYVRRKEEGIAACIERGQELGQIDGKKDARQLARFFVAVIFSMRVLAKMGLPPDGIIDVKNCAMEVLRS